MKLNSDISLFITLKTVDELLLLVGQLSSYTLGLFGETPSIGVPSELLKSNWRALFTLQELEIVRLVR